MADTKVSALDAVTAALSTHEIPVAESGASKKATLEQVRAFVLSLTEPIPGHRLFTDDANIPAPTLDVAAGDVPVPGMTFAVGNKAYTHFRAQGLATALIAIDIDWFAATAVTTGNCRWNARLSAITPNTDTTDITTDTGYGTAADTQTAHLGTTAKRLHRTTVTLSSLDSIAVGDLVKIEISRIAASASEMSGAATIVMVTPRWA